jgi:hypothetical protein
MLVEQLLVLRNVPVVEIGDAEIEQDIEKEGKIQNFKVEPIIEGSHHVLNIPVDSKNPDRFDEKVEQKHQPKVRQEFSLHIKKVKASGIRNFSSKHEK